MAIFGYTKFGETITHSVWLMSPTARQAKTNDFKGMNWGQVCSALLNSLLKTTLQIQHTISRFIEMH